MENVLIVTNFNAGRKKALKYKKQVSKFVLEHDGRFKFADIDELQSINFSEFDTIFVMGGDGSVNKALPYLVNSDKTLGIIPCGTANLLAAKLGISLNIKKALKTISEGNVKKIDIINVNDNICGLRCGFGYDSDIICKTPQSLKNRFGYFAYFIAGILFALRLKNKHYRIKIDGKDFEKEASCLIFANSANMYRNIVSLADNSLPDDGQIDIFMLKTTNPVVLYLELVNIFFGIRRNNSRAEYLTGQSIEIENNWQVCHIDGEKKNLKDNINISIINQAVKIYSK